ncbi:MFS transporter [Amycolatopsis oliviviridis]|uniref:MFS transporter n=1 Tax=Amycolatopsis oliviviridis TaxID=1471590 RepID=A0ABQ3LPP1_9PSEU|nr:MFS transporter [Amycolatopsis oliviviridis]GHH22440.1 MFS transporter [Amycolatopsis oliviviridis]
MTAFATAGGERLGRPFWWLWAGQSLSGLGGTAQSLALPLWVLQVTGSASLTGGAFVVQLLPRVLFSPWAGVLADRFDRRGLSIVLNLVAGALTLVLLLVVSLRNIPLYYLLTVLLGTVSTLNSAVLPSLTPALVPASRLAAADAAQEVTNGAIIALGPLLGAAVAVGLGFSCAVAVNAASFVLAALLTLPVPRQEAAANDRRRPFAMLRDGLHALTGDRLLRTAVLAEAALFAFLGAVPQFAVILVGEGGRTGEAGLFASAMGVGWLAVSASVAKRRNVLNPAVMVTAGAALAAPVIGLVVLCAHAGPVWVFLAGLVAGAHNLLFAMPNTLLCQRHADPAALGRVLAFRRSFVVSAQCLSLALVTFLTPVWGVGPVLAAAGIAATVTALPVAVLSMRRASAVTV